MPWMQFPIREGRCSELGPSRNDTVLQAAQYRITNWIFKKIIIIRNAPPKAQAPSYSYPTNHKRTERKRKSTCLLELQLLSHSLLWERKTEKPFCSWLRRKPRTKPQIRQELEAERHGQCEKRKTSHPWSPLASLVPWNLRMKQQLVLPPGIKMWTLAGWAILLDSIKSRKVKLLGESKSYQPTQSLAPSKFFCVCVWRGGGL